jgi:thiol-disulfide isomerase/thioredoxin
MTAFHASPAAAFRRILPRTLAILFLILLTAFVSPAGRGVSAQSGSAADKVIVYVFWGDGCPHCAKAIPYLEGLAAANPAIDLRLYEVWNNEANRTFLFSMGEKFGFEPSSVPTTFIGSQYIVGFNDQSKPQIEGMIAKALEEGYPDAAEGVAIPAGIETSSENSPQAATPAPASTPAPAGEGTTQVISESLSLPLIGTVDLSHQSVWVSTLLIALVDGFNPCSLWVLSMLLALTVHTGSRKKVLWIGLIFVTVTAAIYALFIAGLFSFLTITSFAGWIRVVVALVALFFALVNIKDYFWFKQGVSLTIKKEDQSGIMKRMRGVMDASQSFWGLSGATVVLAAGVSLVEFSCTAGFPVVWTNLLTAQQVTPALFAILLVVYMLIYQLDELVIFLSAVFTLRTNRMEEKQGRILKLGGGMLMLTLALVMLINPNLMNNLGTSLVIFGAALLATLLVLLVHRTVLPRMGVRIGSEAANPSPRRRKR